MSRLITKTAKSTKFTKKRGVLCGSLFVKFVAFVAFVEPSLVRHAGH